jgi:Ca2+-binding EF-hand superfamily protein
LWSDVPPETPNTIPFAVVFLVQIPAYLYLIWRNVQYWLAPTPRAWLHGWLMEHQRNLMFCVQVTLYTGLANATARFADWLTPFLFGAIDVGFLVWILTKDRSLRRELARSRLGLALVSALGSGPKKRAAFPPPSPADAQFVARLFDLDGNGTIEMKDVTGLLAAQGVVPTAEELARLREALDHDEDGKLDRRELASFLAEHFVAPPTVDDELALAFRSLDHDGDGRVTLEELRRELGSGDDALSEEEIEAVMESADLDKSGAIELGELADTMSRPTMV